MNIQKIGLSLFLVGFIAFIATLSLGEYQLTPEVLKTTVTNADKRAALTPQVDPMFRKRFGDQFNFVANLKGGFELANAEIKQKYAFSQAEIDAIAAKNGKKYSKSPIDELYPKGNELNDFKNKALKDYTGWLESQSFADAKALKEKLTTTIQNINNDVIQKKGFSSYEIKNLLFSITKASSDGWVAAHPALWFLLTIALAAVGGLLYILPSLTSFPGIKNNGVFTHPGTSRGWIGILVGSFLISFYIFLYWFPEYITSWVLMVDPLSNELSGNPASQWFLYGLLYCVAMLVMGVRMAVKYRHNRYQLVRTASVVFFQLAFAFLIPEILVRFNQPYMDFKNIWPLDYDFFFAYNIDGMVKAGTLGIFMLGWGIALFAIAVPIMTYFFGKRWYCSWVCGCGGLAETLGDPYRQLSDKSVKAWKVERYLIHSVLVFAVAMTGLTLYTYFTGASQVLFLDTYMVQKVYGFLIGSAFAGVVGTGFYPLMGNRVWCRFGCPLAAYMGIVQRFKSRFRITTNGGQCISCGNCSTYCEMGIDVRAYAQKGQNIVRASCVGCGICAAVCPRGVLKLENAPEDGRIHDQPILIGNDSIDLKK
ncbi:4Fe-4S binding protein [Microscilla marina]|uniref:4Fe-4S binding domain protein n=1 Tax=Microscilla marina ATCC 23134 TaxID=313606 RepID=A1ZDQ6_MICM2|nr:4Fe-4S binding protein [Microscilla marina]EAY31214.1 4Fe-4S binding domain protein [Microscilla marina ATCC 23134]